MATVAQIIAWAKRKKNTSESDANLILDLDSIQDDIFVDLNTYNEAFKYFKIYSTVTVSGTLNYTLPADCDIRNIISLSVSQEVIIDSDTEWYTFEFAGLNDNVANRYVWSHGAQTGEISLSIDGQTIDTDGLTIRIYYLPTITQITLTTQTPDLPRQYHNLYKYALVQSIASQGDNPDITIANYYQQKYDLLMEKIKSDLDDKYHKNPYNQFVVKGVW